MDLKSDIIKYYEDIIEKYKELYKHNLSILDSTHHAIVKSKDEQIQQYKKTIESQKKYIDCLLETMSKLDIKIFNINNNSQNFKPDIDMNNINQLHSGNGDNVGRDKNITNIYNPQDLIKAAADIQALLEQLDKNYDLNSTPEIMALATETVQHIENDTNFKNRIIKSLASGSIAALASLLNHPAASFVIEAIKTWQQTKK